MSSKVDLIAIIHPKPGKADRVVELLNAVSAYIIKSEPGTLRYEITREKNKKTEEEQIIMIESYKDKAALNAHGASETFKGFGKALREEDLVSAPMELKFLKQAGGFASRL